MAIKWYFTASSRAFCYNIWPHNCEYKIGQIHISPTSIKYIMLECNLKYTFIPVYNSRACFQYFISFFYTILSKFKIFSVVQTKSIWLPVCDFKTFVGKKILWLHYKYDLTLCLFFFFFLFCTEKKKSQINPK